MWTIFETTCLRLTARLRKNQPFEYFHRQSSPLHAASALIECEFGHQLQLLRRTSWKKGMAKEKNSESRDLCFQKTGKIVGC